MDTKNFFELNKQLSETLRKVLKAATAIIPNFIDRHGKDGTVNIERFFTAPDEQERAEPIYVFGEDPDDYSVLGEEPLKTVTKQKMTDGTIWILLNGESMGDSYMGDWYNRPIVADIVAALEAIEEDINDGEASFKDGVLAYKEDETE